MKKQMLIIGIMAAVLLTSGYSTSWAKEDANKFIPKNKPWPYVNLAEDTSYESLKPFLEKGELNINYFNTDGSFKQTTVMALIAAPPAKVWPYIVDFDNYAKYMPRVGSLGIFKRDPVEPWLYYELEIPGPNYFFTVRVHLDYPKTVEFIPEKYKGSDLTGGWRYDLYPIDNGTKTVLVFKMYCDVRDQSFFIRQTLKMDPSLEMPLNLGINLSTGILNLQVLKRKAETGK